MDLTKTVKIKIGDLGHCTLATPSEKIGAKGSYSVLAVENVPVDVRPALVSARMAVTVLAGEGWRVRYSQIGHGKVAVCYA